MSINAPLLGSTAVAAVAAPNPVGTRIGGIIGDAVKRSEWDFPGWGEARSVTVYQSDGVLFEKGTRPPTTPTAVGAHSANLGQFRATAIAGNDLLSSCLYTAGSCASASGKLAPICLVMVSGMLYFFRFIYSEVVTAMPVNGGSYNALLNTTNKKVAALAACLSLISYIATAVVSACYALIYLQTIWTSVNIQLGTVALLAAFALLTLLGIGESAAVAVAIFFLHVITLTILVIWSFVYGFQDGWTVFVQNWQSDQSDIQVGSWPSAIFFGYASALLGITGFETAANYVEEMKSSTIYLKTLRNMWGFSALFNPLISLGVMAVLPIRDIVSPDNSLSLLASVGYSLGGQPMKIFVCIDAFIVLAGSVLTAYVGVMGLARRLALDRCLPDVLLKTNKWRGTPHVIILGFFVLTSSLFLIVDPPKDAAAAQQKDNVDSLGDVFDIAFLSVMSAFALAAIILKWKRPDLPRLVIASAGTVATGLVCVLCGLIGTIVKKPATVAVFALYFGLSLLVVFTMFNRTKLLQLLYFIVRACLPTHREKELRLKKMQELKEAHKRNELVRLSAPRSVNTTAASSSGSSLVEEAVTHNVVGLPASSPGTTRTLSMRIDADLAKKQAKRNSDDGLALNAVVGSGAGRTPTSYASLEEGLERISPSVDAPYDDVSVAVNEAGGEHSWRGWFTAHLSRQIRSINSKAVVFFAKEGDLTVLNKAVLYVRDNELTSRLVIVHVVDDTQHVAELARTLQEDILRDARRSMDEGEADGSGPAAPRIQNYASLSEVREPTIQEVQQKLEELPPLTPGVQLLMDNCMLLDTVYPKLKIDCIVVRGSSFGPGVVSFLSRYLDVTPNMMFMAMPDERFSHQFAALGGLRVITKADAAGVRQASTARLLSVLKRVTAETEAKVRERARTRTHAHAQ